MYEPNKIGKGVSLKDKEFILEERARKIALNETEICINQSLREVVVFALGEESYAIEVTFIKEVYPLIDVTVLPCVPNWVYGVINVRRKIYSVVDLKSLFGLPQNEVTSEKKVILLEDGNISFGILADEISGVQRIEMNRLQSQLPTQSHRSKEFFRGITNDGVNVLNGSKLLNSQGLIVDEAVT